MSKKILILVAMFCLSVSVVYAIDAVDSMKETIGSTTADMEAKGSTMKEEAIDMMNGEVKGNVIKKEVVEKMGIKGSDMVDSIEATGALDYEIDKSHTTIGFAVKHLQIGTTRGTFDDYTGWIAFDPNDLSTFSADVSIDVASINTRNEGRDKHLRSPDFFDAETYDKITFKSNRLEKRGGGHVIVGDLTIRDVTKQLTIPVQLSGPVVNMSGGSAIGLNAQITINRQDYGVSWSKTLDNGGLAVADNVDLIIEIEAHSKG